MKEKNSPIINNGFSNNNDNNNLYKNNSKIEDSSEQKIVKKKSKIHQQLGYKLKLQNNNNKFISNNEEDDDEFSSINYDLGKNIYRYNIILVGDCSVGKTSIINRFIDNRFNRSIKTTINIEFKIKSIKLDPNTVVDLKIWDTCGEERFHSITKNFYHEADGIFIVFDLGNFKSFSNIKIFLNDIKDICNIKKKSIMIIGNKNDIPNEDQVVKFKDIKGMMDLYQEMKYLDVSARSGDNIENMFISMSKLIFANKNKHAENEDEGEDEDNNGSENKIEIGNSNLNNDIRNVSQERERERKDKCC
jgi:small GTP-binding protein